MSKRHQASRRRTYGRRQHEVNERPEQAPDIDAVGSQLEEMIERWTPKPIGRWDVQGWLQARGID
jgi:hypothetical protein